MRQYKILLITEFSKPWNNGWYYKAGVEKNGYVLISEDSSLNLCASEEIIESIRQNTMEPWRKNK